MTPSLLKSAYVYGWSVCVCVRVRICLFSCVGVQVAEEEQKK